MPELRKKKHQTRSGNLFLYVSPKIIRSMRENGIGLLCTCQVKGWLIIHLAPSNVIKCNFCEWQMLFAKIKKATKEIFLQELVENPTGEYLLDRSKRVLQFVIK